jgi:hypothetical protein
MTEQRDQKRWDRQSALSDRDSKRLQIKTICQ